MFGCILPCDETYPELNEASGDLGEIISMPDEARALTSAVTGIMFEGLLK
jgi:hypothetical protein